MSRKLFLSLGFALSLAACENLPGTGGWADDVSGPSNGSTGGGNGTLWVQNKGSLRMTSVYFAPCTDTSWGSNRVYSDVWPNEAVQFSVAPDCYDVMGRWGTVSSQSTRVIVKSGRDVTATLVP